MPNILKYIPYATYEFHFQFNGGISYWLIPKVGNNDLGAS